MSAMLQPYRHPLAQTVHDSFAQGRFLDAWSLAQPFHQNPEAFKALTVEEQVLGARVSWSVGGARLSHVLFRQAERRAPDNAQVRLFRDAYSRKRVDYLKSLQDFEKAPDFNSGKAELDAHWLANHARLYSLFRDFERAHQVLDQAAALAPDLALIAMTRGQIFLSQDEIEQARHYATEAWRREPAYSSNFRLMLEVAGRCNREAEAAQDLLDFVINGGQSGHALLLALLTLCRGMERMPTEQAAEAATRLTPHLARFDALFPLADKHTARIQAALQAEFAKLKLDREGFITFAKKARFPYFDHLAEAYQRCPDGERLLLPHATPRQKHNTCVPGSITACLQTLGVAIDHDAIAEEITYDGTECWRVADWAKKNNLLFYPFIAERDTHLALLRAGIPSIMSFHQAGDMGHAVAVVGYDEATDSLIYHDPSSATLGEQALSSLRDENEPGGPLCFVVAPPDRQPQIEAIPLHRAAAARAFLAFCESLSTQSPTEAWQLGARLNQDLGDDPVTSLIGLQSEVLKGNWRQALEDVTRALSKAPKSLTLLEIYLQIRARSHDSDAYERTLEAVVNGDPLPDLPAKVEAPWNTQVVADLTRHLNQSHSSRDRADRFLALGLAVNPAAPELLAVKVDTLSRQGRFEDAIFYSRLTTTLQPTNPYFISEYVWLLRKLGHREQALTLLAERAEKLCTQAGGSEGWITGVNLTAQFGEPDRALALLKRGLARRPKDGDLWAFAASFSLQQGLLEEEQKAWEQTKTYCQNRLKLRTGFYRFFHFGRYDEAAAYLEQWLEAAPEDVAAREMKKTLVERTQGAAAARDLPRQWSEANPDSKQLNLFFLQNQEEDEDSLLPNLEAWLERHPRDAWGRRALLFQLIHAYRQAERTEQPVLWKKVEAALATAWAEDPFHPHTRHLKAICLLEQGHEEQAAAMLADLLCDEPEDQLSLQQLVRIYHGYNRLKRAEFIDILDRCFTACRHDFELAAAAVFTTEHLLGFKAASAMLQRWRQSRPDDPFLVEAAIDLNLQRGEGLRSLPAIKDLVHEFTARYPRHRGFTLSLIDYYRHQGQSDRVGELYRGLIDRAPTELDLRFGYINDLQQTGDVDEILKQADAVTRFHPYNEDCQAQLITILVTVGCDEAAQQLLDSALARLPASPPLLALAFNQSLARGDYAAVKQRLASLDHLIPDPALCARLKVSVLKHPGLEADEDKITELYESIVKHNPEDWTSAQKLLEIYFEKRATNKARVILKRCRRVNRTEIEIDIAETVLDHIDGDKKGALERLAKILERDVNASWGWTLVTHWIESQEALEIGHDLLLFLDEELSRREELAGVRADLADVLDIPTEQIIAFWEELRRDFPYSNNLHNQYFHWLYEQDEIESARALMPVLRQLETAPGVLHQFELMLAVESDTPETMLGWLNDTMTSERSSVDLRALLKAFYTLQANFRLRPLVHRILAESEAGRRYHPHVYSAIADFAGNYQWISVIKRLMNAMKGHEPALAADIIKSGLQGLNHCGEAQLALAWFDEHFQRFKEQTSLLTTAAYLAFSQKDLEKVKTWTASWKNPEHANGDLGFCRLLALTALDNTGVHWTLVAMHTDQFRAAFPNHDQAHTIFFYHCLAKLSLGDTTAFLNDWDADAERFREALAEQYLILALFTHMVRDPYGPERKKHQADFALLLSQNPPLPKVMAELWQRYSGPEPSFVSRLADAVKRLFSK